MIHLSRLASLCCSLVLAGACASAPPPAEATAPIPTTGQVTKVDTKNYMHYAIGINIAASENEVWSLLTDASRFTEWNSSVLRLDGEIVDGAQIELVTRANPKRVFKLTVSAFDPPREMVWEDGGKAFMGRRTFRLTPRADGTVDFTMKEAFTGSMLPMIKGKLPDFTEDFEAFATDLQRAAAQRRE